MTFLGNLVSDVRQPDYSGQFKRDVKQVQKRGKDMDKLKSLLGLLIKGSPLPANYLDHPLKGGWRGFRDAHIEPDWLLIYKIHGDVVRFERTGRHTDLFGE
uniref:ORF100 n=2 Tax=root TaxID=1 RepID=Q58KC3_9BACT|nr:type II toxin-antitoxin system mRNA interferase toxin, RelE/StbE family [Leptospirillum ferrooxidans]AAX38516.1 ORF100 [Leptospirillum ferrooxidans]